MVCGKHWTGHPAGLNMGDGFAYAGARARGAPSGLRLACRR